MSGDRSTILTLLGALSLSGGAMGAYWYMKSKRKQNRRFLYSTTETERPMMDELNVATPIKDDQYVNAGDVKAGEPSITEVVEGHVESYALAYASDSSWVTSQAKSQKANTKTDLLHRGHAKGGKLLICMVGCPGAGKTLIARKVARYLRWISYRTKAFSVAKYRLDKLGSKSANFFDPDDSDSYQQRLAMLAMALEDACRYLHRGGEIAILDATNTTRDRRDLIRRRLAKEEHYGVLWIESNADINMKSDGEKAGNRSRAESRANCNIFLDNLTGSVGGSGNNLTTADAVNPNLYGALSEGDMQDAYRPEMLEDLKKSPDFLSFADYLQRKAHYTKTYEPVGDDEGSVIRILGNFQNFALRNIHGSLPTKIVSFVINLKRKSRPVYFCRHGESTYNARGLIGGDGPLSPKGVKFAERLRDLVVSNETERLAAEQQNGETSGKVIMQERLRDVHIWVSTMHRAKETAAFLVPHLKRSYVEWRALKDIEVGVCDGMSYEQVRTRFPQEYLSRSADKLRYRYPRGESYLDVLQRLEPVIFELERGEHPVCIIAHQAVLRCLYAYFLDLPIEEIPFLDIPLHTLFRLEPQTFGCHERRVKINLNDDHEEAAPRK